MQLIMLRLPNHITERYTEIEKGFKSINNMPEPKPDNVKIFTILSVLCAGIAIGISIANIFHNL